MKVSDILLQKMVDISIQTAEMHTGGQAVRIVGKGQLDIKGQTLLDKVTYCKQNLDHIRKLLMLEPRGHSDMCGVYLVEPDMPGAVVGCIFIQNEGYSTMCGDVIISVGRYLVDHKLVETITSPETRLTIQCPCGPVEAIVEINGTKAGTVRFTSVPSFVYQLGYKVAVPEVGNITVDIVFGGAFYAVVPASRVGVDLDKTGTSEIAKVAFAVTQSIQRTLNVSHPEHGELATLLGTIITDGKDELEDSDTRNVCVYADRAVDRSPCGSAVTSRVALQYKLGLILPGQVRTFRSPTGAVFRARVVQCLKYGGYGAVTVEVSGKGYFSGSCEFTLESEDEIGTGFLLR